MIAKSVKSASLMTPFSMSFDASLTASTAISGSMFARAAFDAGLSPELVHAGDGIMVLRFLAEFAREPDAFLGLLAGGAICRGLAR